MSIKAKKRQEFPSLLKRWRAVRVIESRKVRIFLTDFQTFSNFSFGNQFGDPNFSCVHIVENTQVYTVANESRFENLDFSCSKDLISLSITWN